MTAVTDETLERARRNLEREYGPGWRYRPYGPAGMALWHPGSQASVIVTSGPHEGVEWLHASIAYPDRDPTYAELSILARAVYPEAWTYQVFAPPAAHVNIHDHALHLWGRLDGDPVLPNFGEYGTI